MPVFNGVMADAIDRRAPPAPLPAGAVEHIDDLRFGDLAIGHLYLRYDFVRQSASWHWYEWRPAP